MQVNHKRLGAVQLENSIYAVTLCEPGLLRNNLDRPHKISKYLTFAYQVNFIY